MTDTRFNLKTILFMRNNSEQNTANHALIWNFFFTFFQGSSGTLEISLIKRGLGIWVS